MEERRKWRRFRPPTRGRWKKYQAWKRPWWKNWALDPKEKAARASGRRIARALRRRDVARLKAAGLTRAQIGQSVGIAIRTVQNDWDASLSRVIAMTEMEIYQAEQIPAPRQPETTAAKALELRKQGWNYQKIAVELQITDKYAQNLVGEELKRIDADEIRSTDKARRLMIEQLDEMLSAIWTRVVRGDLEAMMVALRLMERRAKLIGLDAPQKVDIELQVRQAARQLGLDEDEAVRAAEEIAKSGVFGQ